LNTSRAIRSLLVLLLATWVWAAPLCAAGAQDAQAPAAQEPAPAGQQPPAVFRGGVDSISVDVRVTDLKGRPVTDLRPEDFEIREGGRVQTITNFKLIEVDDGLDDPAARSALRSLGDQSRETAREDNRLLAIFLDDYHVRDINAVRIREQLADFVRTLTPHDLVALATPTMSMQALTFSREHQQTAAMILNFEGRKYDYRPRTTFEERYANQLPAVQERMRNDLTLAALEGLCVVLGSLRDGRKTLLFVSEGLAGTLPAGVRTRGGFPMPTLPEGPTVDPDVQERRVFLDQAEILSDMQQVFRVAARANTAIYTIDPRGLSGTEFSIEDSVNAATDTLIRNQALDSLRTIALETDGRSIIMKGDPLPQLRQMVEDASTYYLLGYNSSIAPRDGKFHEIEVHVRRPAVRVSARKGYWAYSEEDVRRAMAPPRPAAPPEVADALEALTALTARAPSAAGLTVWAGARQPAPDQPSVTVVWEAPPSLGRGTRAVVKTVELDVTSDSGETVFKGPVAPVADAGRPAGQATFDAPPGAMLRVRVTATDGGGVRLDVRDHHLEVPDASSAPGLRLTTPFVFRGRTALDLREVRTQAAPMPTAGRTFARSERMLVRFQAFAPGGAPPAVTIRLLNATGQPLATIPAEAAANSPSTYEAELAFGAFPPADYVLEIAAAADQDVVREYLALRIGG
jgi:VWFA-related protein